MRNRIINGAMVIDQRNAGASVSVQTTTGYTLDRWAALTASNSKYTVQQNAGSITPPVGFSKYLGVTVGASASVTVGATDQYLLRQGIEGFNMADLAWGTASAAPITISFWVRSSLTGIFGGALKGGGGGSSYSYPFSFSISLSNTWEQKTITIPGQTAGTWTTDNTLFTWVSFDLGVGSTYSGTANAWANTYYSGVTGAVKLIQTNSATFYITGVQLERGSTASSFEYRSYGTELALCQRYFEKSYDTLSAVPTNTTLGNHVGIVDTQSLTAIHANIRFRVEKRTNPTMNFYKYETTAGVWARNSDNSNTGTLTTPWGMGTTGVGRLDSSTSLSSGGMYHGQWSATAEL
jgi:hypothetical protein